MPNLFKRKQVWFQVLVYSRFYNRRKPHSLKMAWHSPEFKDSTLANNFETLSPDTRLWELGAHFGERHISLANSSLQSAISIKLSPLLVFTVVVAPIIAIHKLQSHSMLYLGPRLLFTSSIRHLVLSLRRTVPLFIFFVCYFWLQRQHN